MRAQHMVTVAEVVRLYRVKASYVYWLASTQRWRRLRHEGRVYYDLADVDRALGK